MNPPRKLVKPMSLDAVIDQALQQPPVTIVAESGAITQVAGEPAPPAQETPVGAGQGRARQLPWETANERIIHYFQVRMPETLKLKLEWLELQSRIKGERPGTKGMQHKIVLTILEREIDKLVAKELKGEVTS